MGISNNEPAFIAKYFVDCVKAAEVTARIVRADLGTENTYVAGVQRFLRNNSCYSFSKDELYVWSLSI